MERWNGPRRGWRISSGCGGGGLGEKRWVSDVHVQAGQVTNRCTRATARFTLRPRDKSFLTKSCCDSGSRTDVSGPCCFSPATNRPAWNERKERKKQKCPRKSTLPKERCRCWLPLTPRLLTVLLFVHLGTRNQSIQRNVSKFLKNCKIGTIVLIGNVALGKESCLVAFSFYRCWNEKGSCKFGMQNLNKLCNSKYSSRKKELSWIEKGSYWSEFWIFNLVGKLIGKLERLVSEKTIVSSFYRSWNKKGSCKMNLSNENY